MTSREVLLHGEIPDRGPLKEPSGMTSQRPAFDEHRPLRRGKVFVGGINDPEHGPCEGAIREDGAGRRQ
jgi:hypothetical protein